VGKGDAGGRPGKKRGKSNGGINGGGVYNERTPPGLFKRENISWDSKKKKKERVADKATSPGDRGRVETPQTMVEKKT